MNEDTPAAGGASMIDRTLPKRRPQSQAQASECCRRQPHRPVRAVGAVGGFPNATKCRMIGLRKTANGESR